MIASWGDVTLTPLDQPTMEALSRGDTITAGLVIDFLADSAKSAREGLPVFHMGGGSGYIWAAKFDDSGKGRLRITAVNPSLLPEHPVEPAPSPLVTDPPTTIQTPPVPVPPPQDPAQVERDHAARAEKAIAAANAQLEEVDQFLKKHPKTASETVVYVDLISALKAAIKTSDPDAIEHEMTALVNALGSDKDYKIYQAEQGEEQKKQDALELGDVIRRGKQERDFIVDYIGKNATADVSADLNAYYKQLNPALQQPILNELKPLVNKVEVAIREAKLEDAFNAWRERSLDTNGPENPPVTDLPLTGKNRFLVEGALDDVEILYNASQNAPHVAENLRGEFVLRSKPSPRLPLWAGIAVNWRSS